MAISRCSGCSTTFAGIVAFDAHRTGSFTHKQHLCLAPEEMRTRGLTRNEKDWWTLIQEQSYLFSK